MTTLSISRYAALLPYILNNSDDNVLFPEHDFPHIPKIIIITSLLIKYISILSINKIHISYVLI